MLQLGATSLVAQNYKFGKVSIEELQEKFNPLDSSANATVLSHKERIIYKYDPSNGFYKQIDICKRIKIYSKEGLEWAKHSVSLYDEASSNRETIMGIKGTTYNFNNESVVKSKLKKDGIFNEKVNKYWEKITIAMPNVKKGSVVEFKYTILSPFASTLRSLGCQDLIPIKNLDYKASVPEYFRFKTYLNPLAFVKPKLVISSNNKNETEVNLRYKENVFIVKEKNVPALEDEVYVSNLENYKSKLSYELESIKSFNYKITSYSSDWNVVTKKIYEGQSFGAQLEKNSYYKEEVDELLKSVISRNDKIVAIFNFVKQKVKWNEFVGYSTHSGVRKAFKEGVGNVAEINLMLVSMLRYAGVKANPILVSTKSNGVPLFPTRKGFNYVICGIEKENNVILLDATKNFTTINIIPESVLNWQGRIIREHGSSSWVNLFPKQNSVATTMLSVNLSEDLIFNGKLRSQKTDYLAYDYRNKYADLGNEGLIKSFSKDKGEIEISNLEVKNGKNMFKPILQSYEFAYQDGIEEIGNEVYVDPLLFLTNTENIFNQEERKYNIDFNFPRTQKTIVSITIPEGYKVKSVPESVRLAMSDQLGDYSFLVKQNGNKVQVSQTLKVNFSIIPASYYPELKEVYRKLVQKNAEKIVLEKI